MLYFCVGGDMQVNDIVKIVKQAADSLSRSLQRYWPTNGPNEVAERNQTAHLAGALLQEKFHLWAEAHTGNKTNLRHDLVAWHDETRTLCVVEAKRLYGTAGLSSITDDVRRIHGFGSIPHKRALRLEPVRRLGVVLATTWNPMIVDWWKSKPGDKDPWKVGTAAWRRARTPAVVAAERGEWGACCLGTESNAGDFDRHHLLYGIWEVPAVGPAPVSRP